MRTQVFQYRFKQDAEVKVWRQGKESKEARKKGDVIGVIGYADDEDKNCAGPYGHAGDKGFQYMGDAGDKGVCLTGILQDGRHIELYSGSIELIP